MDTTGWIVAGAVTTVVIVAFVIAIVDSKREREGR